MYIVKNIMEGKTEMVKSEIERRIKASNSTAPGSVKKLIPQETPFSYSLSSEAKKKIESLKKVPEEKSDLNSKGLKGVEKKIGKARGKRGRGKGCE